MSLHSLLRATVVIGHGVVFTVPIHNQASYSRGQVIDDTKITNLLFDLKPKVPFGSHICNVICN
jgi:hypothetical protein